MASVENLSDSELRLKLHELGHPVGPVTVTTRKLLVKKLKQLMSEKSALNRRSRRLSKFSSGEESGSEAEQNGGRNSRRTTMPPPSLRTNTRKSSGSNSLTNVSPVSSSSTPDYPSSLGGDTSGISVTSRSLHGITPRTSTPASSRSAYEFDSGSDSDIVNSKTKPSHRSGMHRSHRHSTNSSYLSTHSKKAADILAAQFKTNDTQVDSNKFKSRPFFSNFARRLSRLGLSVNPQDIKESDGEEENMVKGVYTYVSRSPPRPTYQYFKTKDDTSSIKWKFWNNSQILSMILLGVFVLFFLWLALAYFKISQKQQLISDTSGTTGSTHNYYPICKEQGGLPRVTCIETSELPFAVQLYKQIHVELLSRSVRSLCGPVNDDGTVIEPHMTSRQVAQFLMKPTFSEDVWKIENGVNNLKLLLLSNKHWGISLLRVDSEWSGNVEQSVTEDQLALPSDISTDVIFVVLHPPISWYCYLVRTLYKIIFVISLLSLGGVVCYGGYVFVNIHCESVKRESAEVMELVDKILQYVSSYKDRAGGNESNGSPNHSSQSNEQKEYVSVRHVHDTLIHPSQRQKMASTWKKAVKFIADYESRIRTEIQQVWGEDTPVWRWLGPPLTQSTTPHQQQQIQDVHNDNHLYPDLSTLKTETSKRVWQGEAFDTCEGSINSLPCSPTQCLKIRHMFQLNKDYGPDWVIKVKDAIVEKCEGVQILHLSVDKDSKEGCVYVKCASQNDAGLAYRQLHGSWFDSKLVTVKYLRLERYHERFPEAMTATVPLKPSNNLRLSLQGGV